MVALADWVTSLFPISNWRNFPAWRGWKCWSVGLLGGHEWGVSPIGSARLRQMDMGDATSSIRDILRPMAWVEIFLENGDLWIIIRRYISNSLIGDIKSNWIGRYCSSDFHWLKFEEFSEFRLVHIFTENKWTNGTFPLLDLDFVFKLPGDQLVQVSDFKPWGRPQRRVRCLWSSRVQAHHLSLLAMGDAMTGGFGRGSECYATATGEIRGTAMGDSWTYSFFYG